MLAPNMAIETTLEILQLMQNTGHARFQNREVETVKIDRSGPSESRLLIRERLIDTNMTDAVIATIEHFLNRCEIAVPADVIRQSHVTTWDAGILPLPSPCPRLNVAQSMVALMEAYHLNTTKIRQRYPTTSFELLTPGLNDTVAEFIENVDAERRARRLLIYSTQGETWYQLEKEMEDIEGSIVFYSQQLILFGLTLDKPEIHLDYAKSIPYENSEVIKVHLMKLMTEIIHSEKELGDKYLNLVRDSKSDMNGFKNEWRRTVKPVIEKFMMLTTYRIHFLFERVRKLSKNPNVPNYYQLNEHRFKALANFIHMDEVEVGPIQSDYKTSNQKKLDDAKIDADNIGGEKSIFCAISMQVMSDAVELDETYVDLHALRGIFRGSIIAEHPFRSGVMMNRSIMKVDTAFQKTINERVESALSRPSEKNAPSI